jgi:16S rRNA (adenine1518-N6/adenine1519-N6)-dimethyltransferase
LVQVTFSPTGKASFAMRRKKLQNGLASGFPELGKQGAGEVIAACGFPENVRGETLDIPQFAALANEIYRRRHHDLVFVFRFG